jgi:hypothetical protein
MRKDRLYCSLTQVALRPRCCGACLVYRLCCLLRMAMHMCSCLGLGSPATQESNGNKVATLLPLLPLS